MNKRILLARDKFMPEMHWREPGFTYVACEPFTKNNEKYKKIHNIFIKTN